MKKYIVNTIEEEDLGCEGCQEGSVLMDIVMLEDQEENIRLIKVPDAQLYEQGIEEGNEVFLFDDGIIMKCDGGSVSCDLKVYGADICKDCLAMKVFFSRARVAYEYIDIIRDTGNLREFLAIRDREPVYEKQRTQGGIGIPLFVKCGRMTLDMNEALAWENKAPVLQEEYDAVAGQFLEKLKS